MTSAESHFFDDPGFSRWQENVRAMRVQSLYGLMTERAIYHATINKGGVELDDISLLHEALYQSRMTINDLTQEELSALADLEGALFEQHLIDGEFEDQPGSTVPDDPRFWQALYERIGFRETPDPNQVIKNILANEAFIQEVLNNKDTPVLVRETDGTITEKPRGEQS